MTSYDKTSAEGYKHQTQNGQNSEHNKLSIPYWAEHHNVVPIWIVNTTGNELVQQTIRLSSQNAKIL